MGDENCGSEGTKRGNKERGTKGKEVTGNGTMKRTEDEVLSRGRGGDEIGGWGK